MVRIATGILFLAIITAACVDVPVKPVKHEPMISAGASLHRAGTVNNVGNDQ